MQKHRPDPNGTYIFQNMKELLHGIYGLWLYLPLSGLSRKWRRFFNKIRGKESDLLQQIRLPAISWRECTSRNTVKIWEHNKANGNIRISELGIINAIASNCEDDTNLFEIGTFDGRTSLNLAYSSPTHCKVFTLDLKPETETAYPLIRGERHMVDKESSGSRIEKYRESNSLVTNKIEQLFGDSAKFDFSPYHDSCSLIFIDGSHAYDYAISDTNQAFKLVKKGGIILWHDYGVWEGVTKALEEIEQTNQFGLKSIKGTSLVYWKNE